MTDEFCRTVRVTSTNGHDEHEAQTLEGAQSIMDANPGMWAFMQGKMTTPAQLVERWGEAPEGATLDLIRPLVGGAC